MLKDLWILSKDPLRFVDATVAIVGTPQGVYVLIVLYFLPVRTPDMESNLKLFLKKQELLVEASDTWGNGSLPLRLRTFVTDALPPNEYITSVRSFILQGDKILVVRNPGGVHLLPGGRIEAGETFEKTLQREIIEETGWTISDLALISFTHFHHLNPKPEGYAYPYPDFIQIHYMAQAVDHLPDLKLPDDYEIESYFHPINEVHTLISEANLIHLRAALAAYKEKSHDVRLSSFSMFVCVKCEYGIISS